jgi:DNA polymerase-3 subunit beta
MRVSCLQENLAKGLAVVGRAVASRSTLPVLANILLQTDGARLKLAATNLELGVSCWIGAKVEEDGGTTVPARLLMDFVNSLPPERIDLELVTRTQTLNLKCFRYEANVKGIDAGEFPLIPTAQANGDVNLASDMMRQMISQVTFAAATDESRPILTGVLVKIEGNQLTLAAADGFRLSVRNAELDKPVTTPISVIIPARALNELARVSVDEENPVQVTITEQRNQVLFHLANIDLVSQLVEGNFPDYKSIIPKTWTTRTAVDTKALLNATKIASLFARDAANVIRVEFQPGTELSPGTLTVRATSAEMGDNVSQIDATVEGQPLEIAFNAKYLIDVLGVLDAPQVVIETTTASSPGVFKPIGRDDYIHVVMPMHLAR